MGADETLHFKNYADADELAGAVKGLTKGLGAHFGFQVTGVPAAFAQLFKCIRLGRGAL
jgi:L-iditol 2-dehydrogenase